MPEVGKLIGGFRVFKATTYQRQKDVIHHLLEQGQKPSTMVISCVDLKLAPAEIFASNPGDLFVLNNVGGLVPKYGTSGIHGIMAAIEYAVTNLEVENIVVLGHSKCDSIKMMMSESKALSESMKIWLSVAGDARESVKREMSDHTAEEQQQSCEHESIIISLRNLLTYPYIAKRMGQNKLNVFGWHFDVETGDIKAFNPATTFFDPIY